MIGFNSRESYQDAVFDIQTQDLSGDRVLETRIYRNGRILATVRRVYGEEDPVSAVQDLMARQHEEVCGRVLDGNYALIFLWISRGIIHFEAREWTQALECFESVLAIDGNNTEVQSHLDEIARWLEEDPALAKVLSQDLEKESEALARSGRQTEADRKRALVRRLGLQVPSAPKTAVQQTAARLQRLLTLSALRIRLPAATISRRLLAASCFLLLVLCVGLIQADTQMRLSPQFHGRLAARYLNSEQILPARNLYGKRLLQHPASSEALSGFWASFRLAGDYPSAIGTLEEVVKAKRPTPWAHFCLAEAYRMASRCDEAVPLYQEAVHRGIPETEGMIGWGLCLLEQNRPEAAIDLLEPLQDREKADFRIDLYLGRAYEQQGMPGRASFHLSSALQKNPTSPLVCLALADSLEAMHQTREAVRLRERAERLASGADGPGFLPMTIEPLSALPGPCFPPDCGTF